MLWSVKFTIVNAIIDKCILQMWCTVDVLFLSFINGNIGLQEYKSKYIDVKTKICTSQIIV